MRDIELYQFLARDSNVPVFGGGRDERDEKAEKKMKFFAGVGDMLMTKPPSVRIQIKINGFGPRVSFLHSCKVFSHVDVKQTVQPSGNRGKQVRVGL